MILDAGDDIDIVFATIIKFGNIVVGDRIAVYCITSEKQSRKKMQKVVK